MAAMQNLSRRDAFKLGAGAATSVLLGATTASPTASADSTHSVFVSAYFVDDSITSDAAICAAIADAAKSPNGIVDFGGVRYSTLETVTISDAGVTLQNGGITQTGPFPALVISAADVTVRDMTFARSQAAKDPNMGFCVAVNGERFHSYNCDYLRSHGPCIYLTNGSCDGAVISGGSITGTAARQNAAAVYAAGGENGNRNITVSGVHIYEVTDGILLFNTSDSLVENNVVETLRKLPTVTLAGWTEISGGVWRQRTATGTPGIDGADTDREDGATRAITVNGSQYGEITTTDSPSPNCASISGGYVYINLNGIDPNTATITSDIVSGYAYIIYTTIAESDAKLCGRNQIKNNTAIDCDGFGIYLQLGGNADAVGNQIEGNTLVNVCLAGVQMASLPFAGIGITGGSETLLLGNYIHGVGTSKKAVPGVRIDFPVPNVGTPQGRVAGTSVSASYGVGFDIRSSNWSLEDCEARDNRNGGFLVFTNQLDAVVQNVRFTDCTAVDNGSAGFTIDGSSVAGIGFVSATITGGLANRNAGQGVQLIGAAANATVTEFNGSFDRGNR